MDPLSHPPRIGDGGLATLLQARGLPRATPVDGWLRDHPERILSAHRAFVEAGSELLLTATFRTLPGLQPDWRHLAARAGSLARRALPGGEVWGSIGPSATPWSDLDRAGRTGAASAWLGLARELLPAVDGLVLETFGSVEEGCAAVRALDEVEAPVVLSWTVRPDGTLLDGTPPTDALRAARDVGASASGFNCGVDPTGVASALARTRAAGLWARPAARPGDPAGVARALAPFADRCAVIGGCCGAGPEAIRLLGALR